LRGCHDVHSSDSLGIALNALKRQMKSHDHVQQENCFSQHADTVNSFTDEAFADVLHCFITDCCRSWTSLFWRYATGWARLSCPSTWITALFHYSAQSDNYCPSWKPRCCCMAVGQ
jgi:hypothetical protein